MTTTFQPQATTRWGYDTTCLWLRREFANAKAARVHADALRRQGWSIDYAYPNLYEGDVWDIVGVRRSTIAERAKHMLESNPDFAGIIEASVEVDGKPTMPRNIFHEAMGYVRWSDRSDAWAEEDDHGF